MKYYFPDWTLYMENIFSYLWIGYLKRQLSPKTEKTRKIEIYIIQLPCMRLHSMTYGHALAKNLCPWGHEIYNFGRPYLGHNCYILSLSRLSIVH